MLSLKDIRNKIKSQTDHYPSTQGYNTELDEIINTAQDEIWGMHQWSFAFQEAELAIRPDIVGETEEITVTVTRGSRAVSFSDAVRKLGHNFYSDTFDGQVIEINGRDYPILTVVDEENILLAQPYAGTNASGVTNWKIKHPYYRLPRNLLKLLQWIQTDKPIPGNTHQYAPNVSILNQSCHYPHSQTSEQASYIFRLPDLQIPPGEKISVSWTDAAGDTDAIPQNRWVEVAWSFKYAGKYGPLSESTISKATGGTYLTLTVNCLDFLGHDVETPVRTNLENPFPKNWEGIRKVLWFNTNINPIAGTEKAVRLGAPCWKPVIDFDPDGDQFEYKQLELDWQTNTFTVAFEHCFSTNASSNLTSPSAGDIPTPVRWSPHNIQQVRPYPRINSSDVSYEYATSSPTIFTAEEYKRIIIRYLARPEPMLLATDGMSLPDDAANCLIYKSLENIFNKLGETNLAVYYANKFKNEIKMVERNHLSSVEEGITRGRWGFGNRNSQEWDPIGPVIIRDL